LSRMGPGVEFDLIRRLTRDTPADLPGIRLGPGDDALILEGNPPLVVSTDLSVEDVHFRRDWLSLQEIGYRAVAAALSDLAAMAAEPVGALVSLALPAADRDDVDGLQRGIHEALAGAGTHLVGGDLSSSLGPLVLDVVVLGHAREPLLRSGARPGDGLWVTGTLGGAGAAVAAWEAGALPGDSARAAFAHPVPRIRESLWLSQSVSPHAGLDISDGLAGDAGHMAAASGVDLILEAEAVPLHPASSNLEQALRGGEDYELLLAIEPGTVRDLVEPFQEAFPTPLARVGRVEAGSGLVFLESRTGGRRPLVRGGFNHFSENDPA